VTTGIPALLRRDVTTRAKGLCEYCLVPEQASGFLHEIDHIVADQHGGLTEAENLALSCWRCNRQKGPNVGSFDPETGKLVPFYNPRQQVWIEHFRLECAVIQPLTAEGRVTVKILLVNDPRRVEERERLIAVGLYRPIE